MLTHFLHAVLVAFSAFAGHHKPLTKVIDRVEQSVVRIEGHTEREDMFQGSRDVSYSCTGFVIATNRVLTDEHCVGTQMTANQLTATVIKSDKALDLALLLVITPQPPLKFNDKPVHRLQELNGVGYGYGFTRITVTFQRVMFIEYAIDSDIAPGLGMYGDFFHGMSGGPIVDRSGDVVGIVQRGDTGFSYGVDTRTIRAFLAGL